MTFEEALKLYKEGNPMNWCGIQFVEGPFGLLMPQCMANPEQQFVGLRTMALEHNNADTPDPAILPIIGDLRRQIANEIADAVMKQTLRFTDDIPGYDPGMPDESEDYGEDQDAPRHSELTDSTLEDFLED